MFGNTIIKVSGMSCVHCERRAEEAAKSVAGVKSASASAKKGEVKVNCGGDAAVIEAVKAAITAAGYKAE